MTKTNFGIFMIIPETRNKILTQALQEIYDKFHTLEHPIQKFDEIVMAFKIFNFELDYNEVF